MHVGFGDDIKHAMKGVGAVINQLESGGVLKVEDML